MNHFSWKGESVRGVRS